MRFTASILSVFQTLGFFLTLLDLPFRWSAWRALGSLGLTALIPCPAPERVAQAGEGIEAALGTETMPDIEKMFARTIPYPRVRKLLIVPLLPFLLVSTLLKLVLFLWRALFLGPPLALLWRNRRYIADAKAVELTRDPDALARALIGIAPSAMPVGAEFREYLFIHAPSSVSHGSTVDRRAITTTLHPALDRRLARLAALGAQHASQRTGSIWTIAAAMLHRRPIAALALFVLGLLLLPLGFILVAATLYLTAMVMTLALAGGLTLAWALLAP